MTKTSLSNYWQKVQILRTFWQKVPSRLNSQIPRRECDSVVVALRERGASERETIYAALTYVLISKAVALFVINKFCAVK
jgi:hypothetical protein